MSTELMSVNDLGRIAKAFALSNLFGFKNETEAFALMCIAQANGLHPAKAAERYHIIQGRPAMKSDAMLAAFQESGGKVKWVKRTDTECILHLEHEKGGELDVKWDKARATASGLWGKSNWKTYPTQMLAARCVSEGVRALYPACLCGMYTPEEVSDLAPQEPAQEPTQQVEAVVVEEPAQEPQKLFEAPKESPSPKATPETRKAGFLKAMEGLMQKNRELACKVLGEMGYEKPEDVPADKINNVYKAVEKAFKE